jgi:hypothetical protein
MSDLWKLSILLSIIGSGLLASPATADQTLRICIGEYEKLCRVQSRADAWFPCGISAEAAGRSVCTIYTPTGQTFKPFRILRVSDESGNRLWVRCLRHNLLRSDAT